MSFSVGGTYLAVQEQAATGLLTRGTGHVFLYPPCYNTIGQGTWVWDDRVNTEENILGGFFSNTTSADADNFSWNVYLQEGTYTSVWYGVKNTMHGIMELKIDGAVVDTIDCYNGAVLYGQREAQTGITISTSGVKTVTCAVNGKNGASSDYYIQMSCIGLFRTA
jgi:hypothetical protein